MGDSDPHLLLTVPADLVPGFSQLLQRGIHVSAREGSSIRGFLHDRLGLSTEYIEHDISTIFLDGRPVDDIDTAALTDGSALALSAAMPGLVGATLRRGGYYAPMRHDISYRGKKEELSGGECFITLKLFNLVASALTETLFEKGVRVGRDALKDFLGSRSAAFWEKCRAKTSDGKVLDRDRVLGLHWDEPWVCVVLQIPGSSRASTAKSTNTLRCDE